ncbi:MAG: hypothetical protein D6795_07695 [Deltaproteobacteria bacterium]|nr:MAG: hypothetical protein D6795_07695 [Deltaproteobacteria bacterium]
MMNLLSWGSLLVALVPLGFQVVCRNAIGGVCRAIEERFRSLALEKGQNPFPPMPKHDREGMGLMSIQPSGKG